MNSEKRNGAYAHILKYTGLFGGVQMLGILVGLVRTKCVALLLGAGGMGLVSLFNSSVSLVSNVTNFGLPMSAVRAVSEEFSRGSEASLRRAISVVRLWSLATAAIGVVATVMLSPLLSWFTFSWNGHTLHFILLAPVVGLTAITGCELAILKALRRMRQLAAISVVNMLAGLLISVPIYYFFGISGIVPSLVLLALSQMVVTVAYSFRVSPPRWSFSRQLWREGYGMVKLGLAFIAAGIIDSCGEFLIRSYLNNVAQIDMVGLYNAGFMLSMTYVGLVFSAMETDYFPRLAGVNNLGLTFRTIVNRQAEVMLLLAAPLLIAFMVSLPVLIPLLFTSGFLPIIGMVRIVILAMFLRAIILPIQYVPLAKGDSRSYLLLEGSAEAFMLVGVIASFRAWGLTGAGLGILMAALCDLALTLAYTRWRYGYRLSGRLLSYMAVEMPLGLAAFALTWLTSGWTYWLGGLAVALVSGGFSLMALRKGGRR